jgi:hypothetical protein
MIGADASPAVEKPTAFSLWLNGVPFLHIASGMWIALGYFDAASGRFAFLLAWIYLAPPAAARLTLTLFGRPQDMQAYRVWWFLTQLQTLFNRLPMLEEMLRLVPGLYPAWIKLWGGSVSPFAYVGPGVLITDRYLVTVERGAVLGWMSALAGHMVVRNEAERFVVVVAAPKVEAEAILGGAAGLGPGATLSARHMLPAGRRVAPFEAWPSRHSAKGAEQT